MTRRATIVASLLGLLLTALPASGPATAASPLPARLTHLGDARQVVIVTATSWTTSVATLQTWEKGGDGGWRRVHSPRTARIGWSGFVRAADRRQGTGKTPAGTFNITRSFGRYALSGVDLPYRLFDDSDWWPYDPADPSTYNVYQTWRSGKARWRTSWAERLWDLRSQYAYAAVINFNMPSGVHYDSVTRQYVATTPADTRRGGGIFLHIRGDGATAGCVAIGKDSMKSVLRWLDPAKRPRIVMGPASVITQM